MDALSFVPQFGGFLYTVASFVVALSVIVAVHEYGHYIVGRWSGIHAEVFSIGFGPVLWSRADKRGTRWQIALLPFGGYVKFLGDADAASGKDAKTMAAAAGDAAALRRTMHGAPLWARSATVAAGPVFNFVMSAAIFAAIALTQGVLRDPPAVGTLAPLPGFENGLQEGDELLTAGGLPVPDFADTAAWAAFRSGLPQEHPLDYTVRRDGSEIAVSGPYLYPPYVRGVVPRSAAADAGLMPGDVITAVDGSPVVSFDQLKTHVEAADGKPLLLSVWRDGEEVEMALAPRRTDEPQADGGFATRWRIGIIGGLAFEPATEPAGLGASLVAGAAQVWAVVETSLSGLKHMITGAISTCNLSGPIGIAETSGAMASQGAESFIRFIAVLSTAVGLLNLFPVPALDGGHLMFYAYEAVAGRPPSDRAVRVLMSLGVAIVLGLMLFALGNDLFC
ncbi:RIP metalloprotease RseP [Cribrihabitans neustonicus]|uniref:RIP metalloprotease RseP n=1 Tax=Cribrihabitans neustonicus TaxID=1429085 RepID=UPI003B5D038E